MLISYYSKQSDRGWKEREIIYDFMPSINVPGLTLKLIREFIIDANLRKAQQR